MKDKHIYVQQKKKKIKHANCQKSAVLKKIVCILNGVCCAIVHLHCINVKKKQLLLKNLTYEQRVQKCDMPMVFTFFCLCCDILALHTQNPVFGAEHEKPF